MSLPATEPCGPGIPGVPQRFFPDPGEMKEGNRGVTGRLVAWAFVRVPFLLHCHVLEHEDNAMMARFDVVP